MPYKTQWLRQIVKVTQWKDGCIYKSEVVGTIWVDDGIELYTKESNDIAKEHGGDFLICTSTDVSFEDSYRTIKI